MPECKVIRVRRSEAFVTSLALALGLANYTLTSGAATSWLLPTLIIGILAASLWFLGIKPSLDPRHSELYALLILPVILYSGLLVFLRQLGPGIVAYSLIIVSMPVFHLLFLSLSALGCYSSLPNHVGRLILNVISLLAGYVGYVWLFKFDPPLLAGLGIVFVISSLLFLQGIFWWSNANIPYSIFYSALSGLLLTMLYFGLFFWPLGYLVTGFVMLLGQYVLMGIIQQYFKKNLTRSVVIEHIVVSLILVTAILMQATWIPNII